MKRLIKIALFFLLLPAPVVNVPKQVPIVQAQIQSKTEPNHPKHNLHSKPGAISSPIKNFARVPEGQEVYRSAQPTLKQLEHLLRTSEIKTVIRLNGKETTGIEPSKEKRLVESLGKKFVYINAHEGYQEGKGYTESIAKALPHLSRGDCLIHCNHGADRTGYIIGAFLKRNYGWGSEEIWEYTIKYNSWEHYILKRRISGYIKYLEGFYPFEEFQKIH